MTNRMLLKLFVMIMIFAGAANAVIYTENFNLAWTDAYANYSQRALHSVSGNWDETHGSKAWHYLTEGTGNADLQIYPQGDVIGNNYIGAVHTNEPYQRVAIDYKIDPGTTPYQWNFHLCLNFDGASSYYFNTHQYAIGLRAGSDMHVVKLNNAGNEEYTTGWAEFATPSGDLDPNVWYRIELEKRFNVITGIVRQKAGGAIVGYASFTDLGTEFTGGYATIRGYSAMTYKLDNFEFELWDEVPSLCGDPYTQYLEGDFNQDCYVDFNDVNITGEQWLNSSDPTDPGFVQPNIYQQPSYKLPHDTSIVVDGDLSDWPANAEWIGLDQWYWKIGNPNDVTEAKFSARWDDVKDVVYAAVVIDESVQYFATQHWGSDTQDCIEIYSQGNAAGGTGWSGEFGVAQQYRTGPDTNTDGSSVWNGGQWYVWGTGQAIEPNVGFQCAVDVTGSVTTYELAIPQFNSYKGLSGGGTTAVTQLDVNDIIGLDIIDFTIDDYVNDYGSLAENMMTGKWNDASKFAKYTLVENLVCGAAGYWSADVDGNCRVNFADFTTLADRWMQCTDPNNAGCDQYWSPPEPPFMDTRITYTDDFSYDPNQELMNTAKWDLAHAAFYGHEVWSANPGEAYSVYGEVPGDGADNGNAFVAAPVPTGQAYERISMDFKWTDSPMAALRLGLNYNASTVATSVFWKLHVNQYIFNINDSANFYLAKRDSFGNNLYWGDWKTFTAPLSAGTWYRATLEKDGTIITAKVTSLNGATVYGQQSFNDNGAYGARLEGGRPIVGSGTYNGSKHAPHFDNFEYELGNH